MIFTGESTSAGRGTYVHLTSESNSGPRLNMVKVKSIKCTLVQALRLCRGRTVHRGSRGIAVLYRHCGSVQAVRSIGGVVL